MNIDILDNAMENKKITIGRDKKCDLVIEDIPKNQKVSGCHATINEIVSEDAANKSFILEDHSTNGTYVNSKLVHNGTYKIQEGDTITLGRDYVLDWSQILPFFGGRKTSWKPLGKETSLKPQDGTNPVFMSAEPVYPDPLPFADEGTTTTPVPQNNGPIPSPEKTFVFSGWHWLITIGAAVVGFILGLLIGF